MKPDPCHREHVLRKIHAQAPRRTERRQEVAGCTTELEHARPGAHEKPVDLGEPPVIGAAPALRDGGLVPDSTVFFYEMLSCGRRLIDSLRAHLRRHTLACRKDHADQLLPLPSRRYDAGTCPFADDAPRGSF